MSKKRRKSVNLEGKSQWGMILFRFRKNKLAVLGVCIIALLALLCLSAGLWLPYERVYQQTLMNRFLAPFSTVTNYDGSKTFYLLGTDQLGRDLFARIIYGGRICRHRICWHQHDLRRYTWCYCGVCRRKSR